jgi:hypothetical protein
LALRATPKKPEKGSSRKQLTSFTNLPFLGLTPQYDSGTIRLEGKEGA